MNTFRTTGWNALSICTNDTERCRYAVLPDASEMHSRMPTGSMARVHSTNVKSLCAPSFKTPVCTSVRMRSHRRRGERHDEDGVLEVEDTEHVLLRIERGAREHEERDGHAEESPKPCRLRMGRTSASSSSAVPLVFSGEGTRVP